MFNQVGDARKAEIDCCVRTQVLLCAVCVGKVLILFAQWKVAGGRCDFHTSSLNHPGKAHLEL